MMRRLMDNRRLFSLLLILCLAFTPVLAGCGSDKTKQTENQQEIENIEDENKDAANDVVTPEPVVDDGTEDSSAGGFDWPEEFSLAETYKDYFLVGTVYTPNSNTGRFKETTLKHFNVITAENIMKPEYMQPKEGKFNYFNSDAMMKFAADNNLVVHGHTLAWHSQSGNWLGINVDRETAIAQLKSHVTNIVSKYKGQIYSWDVLNEAINDGVSLPADGDWTKCLRKTQWLNSIGPDYIAMVFQFAHEADPDAILYYNDYNMNNAAKAKIAHAMVKDLKEQGVPIHGIGMQGHYSVDVSIGSVEKSIKLFSELDVKVSFTELDVGSTAGSTGLTEAQEKQQAITYAKLFQLFKKYSDVIERVTFWGHVDSLSWRSDRYPLLFNGDYTPKESLKAVYNPEAYLAENGVEEQKKAAMEIKASYGTPVMDGEIDDVWNNATSYPIKNQLTAWEGATGTLRLMWDENYIYSLVEVKDSLLNKSSQNLYEQDSVEVFLDQDHKKTDYFDSDDGQYRVNYENYLSFGNVPTTEGVTSGAKIVDGGYVIELAIPLLNKAKEGTVIGYEAQINDSNNMGMRQCVVKLSDLTDNSYQNTEGYANLTLVK